MNSEAAYIFFRKRGRSSRSQGSGRLQGVPQSGFQEGARPWCCVGAAPGWGAGGRCRVCRAARLPGKAPGQPPRHHRATWASSCLPSANFRVCLLHRASATPPPPPPSRRSLISPQASAQQFALHCLFPELSALRTPQYFAFGHGTWMPSWCLARNSGRVTHNLRPSPTPEMSCLRDQ